MGLGRSVRDTDLSSGCHILLGGREVLSLGSNNYLGLAGHPDLRAAATRTIERVGVGSGGSRLATGAYPEHAALERALANWKQTDDALLFDSGYAANTGVIPALVGPDDLVLSDSLNHASLIDGCRLSRAMVRVYPHRDVDAVRELISDRQRFRRVLIVTDGVFSMDGDTAPLALLSDVCQSYRAWLLVDDAHGNGLLGEEGRGLADVMGLAHRVQVHVGTLSKALGASGGFVAGSAVLCRHLRQRARSFVYSTAMPPAIAAAGMEGVRLARQGDDLRERLHQNADRMRSILRRHGFDVPGGLAGIIPVTVGDESEAVALSDRLLDHGVLAPAMRFPTVPRGQARLRMTASAALTEEDLRRLDNALEAARKGA